jgi:hypothetical protein
MRRRVSASRLALVASAALGLAGGGCCRKPPQSIVDVNLALDRAKEACAVLYAPRDLASLQVRIDEMNRLADTGSCRRARSASEPILPDVLALSERVDAEKNRALAEAQDALASAEAAVARAMEAEAGVPTSPDLAAASRSLEEARRMSGDACALPRATALARGAAREAARAGSRRSEGPEEAAGRP